MAAGSTYKWGVRIPVAVSECDTRPIFFALAVGRIVRAKENPYDENGQPKQSNFVPDWFGVLPQKDIKFRTREDGTIERLCRNCRFYKPVTQYVTGRAICRTCLSGGKSPSRVKVKIRVDKKRCCRCHETKPADQFYKARTNNDGLASQCKSCAKEYSKKWVEKNPERAQQLRQSWQSKNYRRYREISNAARVRHRERYPEREKARSAVTIAIATGKLTKQPCVHCGTSEKVQAHHRDYSKPLDVIWLCRPCHMAEDVLRKSGKPSLLDKIGVSRP